MGRQQRHYTRAFCVLLIMLVSLLGFGQDTEEPETSAEASSENEGEKLRSLREERRDTLRFGIDSQVLEVLENIEEERDEALLDQVFATFKLSRNPDIRQAAISLFAELDYRVPTDDVLDIIRFYEEEETELVVEAIGFVSDERNSDVADLLLPLVDTSNDTIARAAIRGIGKTGSDAHAEELLERFESSRYEDERKPEIILAFGELKSESVVDSLIDILENPDEDMTWRRYATDALGKIGNERAFPAIERALVSDDAMLRAYAVSSVQYFDGVEVDAALTQGLRDSFWRVRVSAARALGSRKSANSIPILEYKARHDPETPVREAAIRALAEIGTDEAFETIRTIYEERAFTGALRVTSAEVLAENDLAASIDSFRRVIDQEWETKGSRILERTGYVLSLSEHPDLEPIFRRFLRSGEIAIIIYGIRGAERNGFSSLHDQIEALSGEGNANSIRRAAASALESFE